MYGCRSASAPAISVALALDALFLPVSLLCICVRRLIGKLACKRGGQSFFLSCSCKRFTGKGFR